MSGTLLVDFLYAIVISVALSRMPAAQHVFFIRDVRSVVHDRSVFGKTFIFTIAKSPHSCSKAPQALSRFCWRCQRIQLVLFTGGVSNKLPLLQSP